MEEGRYWLKEMLPFSMMVALECTNVGLNTIFKAATNKGMSHYVFIFYSYGLAAIVLLPSPLLYRKSGLPQLTFSIAAKLFLLGSIGCTAVMLGYKGISDSNPTLASAMSNLIPAFTFILAIIFRMEKLVWRRLSSQAKVLGTAVSIMGALIVILYKGPAIILVSLKSTMSFHGLLYMSQTQWIVGGFLLASEYILTPVWYIVQAQIIRQYPAELVVVFFYNLFVALMSAIVGSVAEPDQSKWRLKPDISMAAIVYAGLVGSFLGNAVHAWVMRRKGPVYVAMFKPVSIIVAAAMGVIFLGDTLHLGSIFGATVIILGFYAFMWGKGKDEIYEELPAPNDVESSAHKTPLLHSADIKQVDGDERFV
ncbi:hypothetical protein Droror1_Dr00023886 [Drosera rotundifolia]